MDFQPVPKSVTLSDLEQPYNVIVLHLT